MWGIRLKHNTRLLISRSCNQQCHAVTPGKANLLSLLFLSPSPPIFTRFNHFLGKQNKI